MNYLLQKSMLPSFNPSFIYFLSVERKLINIQSFKYNWNNKINKIQDGILYTYSRLVGTNVEDYDVLPLVAVFVIIVEPYNATLSVHQNSLLVWTIRKNNNWLIVMILEFLFFQLDWNSFINSIPSSSRIIWK